MRPAAQRTVAVTVEADQPAASPGVVAALLDHLDGRRVASTWFVPRDVDAALIDRLFYAGHEVAGLVAVVRDIGEAVRALRGHDVGVAGVRVTASSSAPSVPFNAQELLEEAGSAGLSYVSLSAGLMAGDEPELQSMLSDASLTVLGAPTGSAGLEPDPLAWLHGAQLAVGRIVEHGGFHELGVDIGGMDRSAGLSAVAEAVDLVSGLCRAQRLRVDRLDRLMGSGRAAGR